MKILKLTLVITLGLLLFACNAEKKIYKQNNALLFGTWKLENIEFDNDNADNNVLLTEMKKSLYDNSFLQLGADKNMEVKLIDVTNKGIWQLSPDSKTLNLTCKSETMICEISELNNSKLVFNSLYKNKKAKFTYVKDWPK